MTTTAYTVTGMTCGHCAQSVTEELERLPAVSSVEVDLADGRVTVVSADVLADGDVRAAVVEAGFELVGRA
ncbi:heavy-metal-associated domain-containing protein [Frankia sp. AgKG'84/4]|uniref:heavy-metal-associated domain-containing protein n=1 Tax=Frankia sp. AgKG'84/4 TaxID=573490 RepID=UPI0020107E38|nr:heavy-metal-associated domain-containing protein [Frankia sp. AgKG'84/4]MCL9795861.1 heavy-metal-associated domain-containing protein [Frankia sp. AgKG'84/4]